MFHLFQTLHAAVVDLHVDLHIELPKGVGE